MSPQGARRIGRWGHEVSVYMRETRSVTELLRLMRVRLALSRVGPLVCPRRVESRVRVRSLGGAVLLRSHTSDISVLNELIVSDGYGPPARMLAPPTTILDLGANTGLAARWFLDRWPGARVVAVEPEPGNVAALRANLGASDGNVLPVAVGGSRRRATLSTSNGEFAYSLYGSGGAGVDVDVVTMSEVLDRSGLRRIDLLKCDIEGAERELFGECAEWIDRVGSMIVECHDGYTTQHLLDDCERGGATFTVLDIDAKPEWGFEVATLVRA